MFYSLTLCAFCLSRTSGLSLEQRGLGRLKLAQRLPASHMTRTPLSRSKGQGHRRGHIVAASSLQVVLCCCGNGIEGRKEGAVRFVTGSAATATLNCIFVSAFLSHLHGSSAISVSVESSWTPSAPSHAAVYHC